MSLEKTFTSFSSMEPNDLVNALVLKLVRALCAVSTSPGCRYQLTRHAGLQPGKRKRLCR